MGGRIIYRLLSIPLLFLSLYISLSFYLSTSIWNSLMNFISFFFQNSPLRPSPPAPSPGAPGPPMMGPGFPPMGPRGYGPRGPPPGMRMPMMGPGGEPFNGHPGLGKVCLILLPYLVSKKSTLQTTNYLLWELKLFFFLLRP